MRALSHFCHVIPGKMSNYSFKQAWPCGLTILFQKLGYFKGDYITGAVPLSTQYK